MNLGKLLALRVQGSGVPGALHGGFGGAKALECE